LQYLSGFVFFWHGTCLWAATHCRRRCQKNQWIARALAVNQKLKTIMHMKCNPWTLALIGAGIVSLPAITQAEEKPSSVMTALSSTTLSGYVDTSAQWNIGTGNNYLPNYAFGGAKKADGFNLNVVRLLLEKPVDPAEAWGAGYKVDLIAGPDANTLATQSSGTAADFGVKQAYVDLRAPLGNGLDCKIGVWDTIIGYEVFQSPDNPNFTRSYGYSLEPTTHTGILLGYQFNDSLSANVGVANTFGPVINQRAFYTRAESYKAYMGSVTYSAPTNWGVIGGSTITGCIINGFNSSPGNEVPGTGVTADQTSYYVGGTFNTPVTGLKVGACYDYAGISKQVTTAQHSGYAEAAGLYLTYQATEKMSLNTRGEYAWCSHGASAFVASSDPVGSPPTVLPTAVFEVTETIQYDLWKNVLARLEFRWDHACSVDKPAGSANDDPYGGAGTTTGGALQAPNKDDSFEVIANFVYKF
jgi:hypothetical protein